ncbi:hypothetical protein MKK70_01865, partial [Methylobacterium sp. E-041]|uniref:hypothetical protein n=1 Tax=Methylobacterium sp. E-041 TaxID=2836573 RepID=UPI001FBB7D23
LGRLHLNLTQLEHDLLRVRLLASPHVQLLWSWLILSISPVQSQPVRPRWRPPSRQRAATGQSDRLRVGATSTGPFGGRAARHCADDIGQNVQSDCNIDRADDPTRPQISTDVRHASDP